MGGAGKGWRGRTRLDGDKGGGVKRGERFNVK